MISNSKYYLGALNNKENNLYNEVFSADYFYSLERGNTVYTNVSNWIGKIALMYPSDYLYTFAYGVNDRCYTDAFNCNSGIPLSSWIFNSLNDGIDAGTKIKSKTLNHMLAPYESVFEIGKSGGVDIIGGDSYLRPVAYLKSDIYIESGNGNINSPYKLSLKSKNTTGNSSKKYYYKEYKIGDMVFLNNEKYYVIKNSKEDSDYVTLLKDVPLLVDELYKYGRDGDEIFVNENITVSDYPNMNNYTYQDGKSVFIYNLDDNIGGMAFYTSDECSAGYPNGRFPPYNFIEDGCNNNYEISAVKKVLNNWANNLYKDNLVDVGGYKVRLLSIDDLLTNLGVVSYNNNSFITYNFSDSSYEWLSKYKYWTMTPINDEVIVINNRIISGSEVLSFVNSIRPVININKCVFEDGCWYEDIIDEGSNNINDISSDNIDNINNNFLNNEETIVNVENTLKILSKVILIISILLVLSGLSFLVVSYIKSRKDRNNSIR